MNTYLGKYSFGIGDRFAHQGKSQLQGFFNALDKGQEITPVWNKSFREHKTVDSKPDSVRDEADQAVKDTNWNKSYLVDADHITLETVDSFMAASDFFTLDVAGQIGQAPAEKEIQTFIAKYEHLKGSLKIEGIEETFEITDETLTEVATNFHLAVLEAEKIYQKVKRAKGSEFFAVEVSMDEVENPQTPLELFFILRLLADAGVPVDTIAPKFTGRFNKGVDYEGDLEKFKKEFEQDLLVIRHAVKEFGLPEGLKLSVHTGSDKFSLYPVINQLIKKYDVGLHLKTAGTTWLEEAIGLAESEGSGLEMIKDIYSRALSRYDELTGPYATVLNIDPDKLPSAEEVHGWSGSRLAQTIRHDRENANFNPHLRQLLHTSYKIAAEKGADFLNELKKNEQVIGKNVVENIWERHIRPLYL